VRLAADRLKNVVPHSVATAFASRVLPVPGGPTIIIPCTNQQTDVHLHNNIQLVEDLEGDSLA